VEGGRRAKDISRSILRFHAEHLSHLVCVKISSVAIVTKIEGDLVHKINSI